MAQMSTALRLLQPREQPTAAHPALNSAPLDDAFEDNGESASDPLLSRHIVERVRRLHPRALCVVPLHRGALAVLPGSQAGPDVKIAVYTAARCIDHDGDSGDTRCLTDPDGVLSFSGGRWVVQVSAEGAAAHGFSFDVPLEQVTDFHERIEELNAEGRPRCIHHRLETVESIEIEARTRGDVIKRLGPEGYVSFSWGKDDRGLTTCMATCRCNRKDEFHILRKTVAALDS